MYLNTRDNRSSAELARVYNKALKGESDYERYLNTTPFIKASHFEDYSGKWDYMVNDKTVNVKANYNERYDTFWVETKRLTSYGPDAWLNHNVDYIAFVRDEHHVYTLSPSDIKRLIAENNFHTIVSHRAKGSYELVAIPRGVLV